MMDEMSVWAKSVDLARKFEAAIEGIDNGNAWGVFKGLDKGETLVKVVYDGQVKILPYKPPKKKATPKPKKAKVEGPLVAPKPKTERPKTPGSDTEPIFSTNAFPGHIITISKGDKGWIE
jgi:hypothetical protein